MELLPTHLQKYVVEQNYDKYTPVDHAVWRFIMRQLQNFLSQNAHESYLDGLEKTGIEIERIPKVSDISKKLEKFGWRAIPVSGFIPPAAFMELQSLGCLPIASDMRSAEHMTYTPAPDIVHEAAGHAPILVHPEFAQYLRQYAQVAKKAIISSEDLELYEAIRVLSDVKESPNSSSQDIAKAEENLNRISKNMSHVSEAAELGRMNWWTAEYGLIGSIQSPKIFGAGLLSSVGEARLCLSDKVKKIPLTVDCVKITYDITEPQPQLFVARDFKHLTDVLEDLANQMAFRRGGNASLDKAIQAKSVNTIQLDSGLQISGILKSYQKTPDGSACYLSFQGPTQLCYQDRELPGHAKTYHSEGFGSPIGLLQDSKKFLADWQDSDWNKLGVQWDKDRTSTPLNLKFVSGVEVQGDLFSRVQQNSKTLVLAFKNARVTYQAQTLFEPAWGIYDMAVGTAVPCVFGGPADRKAYGDITDFVAARIPAPSYSQEQLARQQIYQKVRILRESRIKTKPPMTELQELEKQATKQFPNDWLIHMEIFELTKNLFPTSQLLQILNSRLQSFSAKQPQLKELIQDGINLAEKI